MKISKNSEGIGWQKENSNINTDEENIDLTSYAKKTDIPTKTSELTNDSGFITEHQDISGKADKSYVDTELAKKSDKTHTHSYNDLSDKPVIPSINGLATKKELTDGLAKKSDKTHTHDQYLTEHQDISGKADRSEIPTKTSQLTNDSDFATNASIDEKIASVSTVKEKILQPELWEIGGITSGASYTDTPNRARFKEKYQAKKGDVICFKLDSSVFRFGINVYDETGEFNGVDYGWNTSDFTMPIDGYIRLVLAYHDNRNFTDLTNDVTNGFSVKTQVNTQTAVLQDVIETNMAINSILVEYGRINGASYVFVRIPKYINNGMQIKPKVALTSADGSIDGTKRSTLDYAKDNNCIFTLNAGLFNTSNLQPVGQFIVDGVSLVNTPMADDNGTPIHDNECYPLAIDANGNLTTYPRNADTTQMIQDGIKYAVTGWGKLVDDFQICTEDIKNEIVHPGKYIRQSIGQYQNGDYCICTVDMSRGNVQNEAGLSYEELAQIFVDKGVKFAYSLDGGGSAETVLGKRQLNPIYEGSTGRKVPSVIQFIVE